MVSIFDTTKNCIGYQSNSGILLNICAAVFLITCNLFSMLSAKLYNNELYVQ